MTHKAAAHAARLAFELGCTVVKTKWTGSIESFKKVTSCVPIPVLIAGGPAGSSTKESSILFINQSKQVEEEYAWEDRYSPMKIQNLWSLL